MLPQLDSPSIRVIFSRICFKLRRNHARLTEKLNNFHPSKTATIQVSFKRFHGPLDLNRVLREDLFLIPGIGESLPQEIVTYRERRKGFLSVEKLKNVKGIAEKKFQSFKSYLISQLGPN